MEVPIRPEIADLLTRDGFAHIGSVLTAAALAELRAACDAALCATPGSYGLIIHNVWRRAHGFAHVLQTGGVGALACELLAVDQIVCFQDHLIAKPPGTAVALAWHQDYSYWPLDSPAGLTMWIALDDADRDNGCLRYIPGTHRLGERQPAAFVPGARQPARPALPPLCAREREADAVDLPVRAGDAVVHDPLVWHMSPANHSSRPRRAWSISWIVAGTRWAPSHAPHPFNQMLGPAAGAVVDGPLFPRLGR